MLSAGADMPTRRGDPGSSELSMVVSDEETGGFAVGAIIDIEGAFSNTSGVTIESDLRGFVVLELVNQLMSHMIAGQASQLLRRSLPTGARGLRMPAGWRSISITMKISSEWSAKGNREAGVQVIGICRWPWDHLQRRLIRRFRYGKHLETSKNCEEPVCENWPSVNPKKIEVIVFTRSYKLRKDCNLILNGERLQLTNECKYLGVMLDGRLTWKSYWKKRCWTPTSSMWLLQRCTGIKFSTMVWIYHPQAKADSCDPGLEKESRVEDCWISAGKSNRARVNGGHWSDQYYTDCRSRGPFWWWASKVQYQCACRQGKLSDQACMCKVCWKVERI